MEMKVPIEIDFGDQLPAGVVLAAAGPGDEHVPAATSGFTSTVDGQAFIRLLEGWPEDVLQRLPPQKRVVPSQVDHMLVVCRRDGKADVFINNLELIFHARASRSIKAGEGVTKDDVADIKRFELGVTIPDDAGFTVFVFCRLEKGIRFRFWTHSTDRNPKRVRLPATSVPATSVRHCSSIDSGLQPGPVPGKTQHFR